MKKWKKLKIELKLFHFQSEKTKDEYINEWRKTQNNSAMYTTYDLSAICNFLQNQIGPIR
ncbi:hypothetical protein DERP_002877 [Dermatophagoides pteronyssinus]|uniref:Integrase SAM-like N-terminal domain-containing protein n=1 Tax=Dermatophagoides pteronyssinus TaxID=6956 RepID=A0ABQ8JX03_DERPT|nr:hypothetical protein DERP_002877 [Dermatophagoides pteronyssinus]